MYMISSIKLRKAKTQLDNTEPYFYGLQNQIASILYHFPEMESIFFDNRPSDREEEHKKRGYIVITGDKAMCGAYNHNAIKLAEEKISKHEKYTLFMVGAMGRQYFESKGYNVKRDFVYTATNPSIHRAREITETVLDLYNREELDHVSVIYTRMINSMRSDVEIERLLPLRSKSFIRENIKERIAKAARERGRLRLYEEIDEDISKPAGDDFYIYPSAEKVLERLVSNFVTGFIYGAMVESSASEENARMMAMSSATDNADKMLSELSRQYNKVRQAAITQEITEVIGGAKALKHGQ